MEERTILELNLDRYHRLLENETNPDKRRIIIALIKETESELQPGRAAPAPLPSDPPGARGR